MALVWTLLGLAYIQCIVAEKVRGTASVKDSDGFTFLGKFCFQDLASSNFTVKNGPAAGLVDVELSNAWNTGSNYSLVMYDDQPNSWDKIYDKGLTCEQKISNFTRLVLPLSIKAHATSTHTITIHQHIRPRWWWLYLANCDDEKAPDLDFEVHFKQNTTAWLEVEVGSNDQGLAVMYSVYLGVYLLLFGLQLYAYYVYTIQQYIHQVIKLLTATMGLQLFSVIFRWTDWIIFTESGEHEIFFPIIASLCEILASTVFLLLLLVLAQGWTVSRFEVMYPKSLLAACVTSAVVSCVLYIWQLVGLDEQTTTYMYNTVPQYIYGSLFIIIGVAFVAQCVISHRNEPLASKKNLYVLLALFFSGWFLWPLLRILVGDTFNPWVRDVAIQSISMTLNTITYFAMMLLMWPTWAHQYFNLSMVDTQERILSDVVSQGGVQNGGKVNDYKVLEQDRL